MQKYVLCILLCTIFISLIGCAKDNSVDIRAQGQVVVGGNVGN